MNRITFFCFCLASIFIFDSCKSEGCEKNLTGEYCFRNEKTDSRYEVEISDPNTGDILQVFVANARDEKTNTTCTSIELGSQELTTRIISVQYFLLDSWSGEIITPAEGSYIDSIKLCESKTKIIN